MKRALLSLFALCGLTGLLPAQSVRGVVVDPGGIPVPGVVIQALDTAGAITGRALTNERGEFLLVAGRPGTYTVKTLRIGFTPVISEPITLGAGEERSQRFELANIPFTLSSVKIDGDAVCGHRARDSTATAFAAWEQVRGALAATEITTGARALTVTTIRYERALSPDERVILHDDYAVNTERVRATWSERAPALLHEQGYVVEDALNSVIYHVPGLEMLGSNTFLEDHCLRLAGSSDSIRLGIEFEPTSDRSDIPEVQGTAWLDRKTSALRSLEYRYVNVPPERREANSGGEIEFARFTTGEWAIARWTLRMPVLEQVTNRASRGGVQVRLAEVRVIGAEVTVATRGADTLWARSGLPMSGTITDSLTRKPVAGAIVGLQGLATTATTDAQGRYTLRDVIPGQYTIEVRTPSLDSIKAVQLNAVAFVDTTVDTDVRLLDADAIRRALAARNAAAFAGTVTDSAGHPIPNVEVTFPDLPRSVTTGPDGTFRISDLPAGVHRVLARRVGLGAYAAPISFLAGHVVQRQIVLSPITELNAVTVTADAGSANLPPSFEEHRKVGLGSFFTRDAIAPFEAAPISTILAKTPGLALASGRGHAYVMPTRRPPGLGTGTQYVPEAFERRMGIETGCYSQVYIDHTLMNPGNPTEPFDVNSIPAAEIQAMEFYGGPSSLPHEYSNLNSACGVLVIHTRQE